MTFQPCRPATIKLLPYGGVPFETNAFVTLIHGDAKIFLIGSIEIDKLLVRFKENMAQIQKKSKEVFERYFR